MKLAIALISLVTFTAWAQEKVNNADPAMAIGMEPTPQGDFNDSTKAHQLALKSYGIGTNANCPECAKQNALHEAADDGTIITGAGNSGSGSGQSEDARQ